MRHCCFIGCALRAEWLVVHGPGPDDWTDACTAHVGDLLTDADEHRVYAIAE